MTTIFLLTSLTVLVGLLLARRHRVLTSAAHTDRLQAALAPSIDLIAVVIGAGGTLAQAVAVAARRGPRPCRAAFTAVIERQGRGELLADALTSIGAELGRDYHSLTTILIVSEQGGAPIGALLQHLAEEADQARRRSTATALARLPATLLIPLVVCQLPAAVIGAIVPLAVLAFRHVRG